MIAAESQRFTQFAMLHFEVRSGNSPSLSWHACTLWEATGEHGMLHDSSTLEISYLTSPLLYTLPRTLSLTTLVSAYP